MDTRKLRRFCRRLANANCSLKRQSEAWMLHLHSGEATIHDLQTLRQWRLQSPAHQQAWAEMVRWWQLLDVALHAYAACPSRKQSFVFPNHVSGATRPHRRFMH